MRLAAGIAIALLALPLPHVLRAEPAPGAAAKADSVIAEPDLTEVGLEDLMNLEVTSVSRHEQRLPEIAAAITVIGADQIRASGATTLAELLRLVPGVQVASIDANIWSISARGFSSRIANKLLLLVDGRTVYSPVFSGVYWDEQDLVLDDIERVEVIRGPGAAMWGSNAVNGVINVITRDAHETVGTSLEGNGGTEELGGGSLRWGAPIGSVGAVRIFSRGSTRGGGAVKGGVDPWDTWRAAHAGLRADFARSARSHWTINGELRGGDAGQSIDAATNVPPYSVTVEPRTKLKGGHLLANWRRLLSPHSDLTVQGFADVAERNDDVLRSHVETYDLDLKLHFHTGSHEFVSGLGGRAIRDRLDSTSVLYFDPDREQRHLLSAFAQDEWALARRRVILTLGARMEDTHGTGVEWQPSGRMLWVVDTRQSLWGAVSRAVRTPSRAENHIRYHVRTVDTGGPPAVVTLYGAPDFRSEILVAYEAGYRLIPSPGAVFDVAAFYNQYDHLRSIEPGPSTFVPTPAPHVDVRQYWSNLMFGDTRGVEASLAWSVNRSWKLNAGASCFAMRLHLEPGSQDVSIVSTEDNEPRFQAMLESQLRFGGRWRWDATVFQVGQRAAQGVPAYTRLDLGLGCELSKSADIRVVGRNLLDDRHLEDNGVTSGIHPTEVQRSVSGRLSVHF